MDAGVEPLSQPAQSRHSGLPTSIPVCGQCPADILAFLAPKLDVASATCWRALLLRIVLFHIMTTNPDVQLWRQVRRSHVLDYAVARTAARAALPNGDLDTSFGVGGMTTDALTTAYNEAQAVIVQADAKIVILEHSLYGASPDQFALVRFDRTGHLDRTFGLAGRVFINIPHPLYYTVTVDTLLLQPDQKFLVSGGVVAPRHSGIPTQTALARYTSAGAADGNFGTRGVTEVVAIGAPIAMALLADGSSVAVNSGTQTAQFNSVGTLLPRVVGGTVTTTTPQGQAVFRSDSEILVASAAQGPFGRHDFDVQALLVQPNGTLDTRFQSPIFDFIPGGPVNVAQAIAIGPTGAVALGGLAQDTNFVDNFAVARLRSNGSLDAAFGHGGTLTMPLPMGGQVFSIIEQPDDKILAIGQAFSNSTAIPFNLAMARYLTQ